MGLDKEGKRDVCLTDFVPPGEGRVTNAKFPQSGESVERLKRTLPGEPSLPLPTTADNVVKSKTDLLSSPDQATTLVGELSAKTSVETLEGPTQRGLVKVVVTSGPLAGLVGWMETKEIVGYKPAADAKKKK